MIKIYTFQYRLTCGRYLIVSSLSHVQLSCDPLDCSPPGFSVYVLSQARILKWVAISFSKESSWPGTQTCLSCIGRQMLYHWATREAHVCVCVCLVSQSGLTLCDPWDIACQAPLSMVILQARILEWVAMTSSRGFSQQRDWIQVSHSAGRFFTVWVTREAQGSLWYLINGGLWHSAKSNTKWKTTSTPSLTILYRTVKDTIIIENILFVHQLGSSLPDGRCGVFGQNLVQCQTSFLDWAGVSNACEESEV